jgi:hypothetical protein
MIKCNLCSEPIVCAEDEAGRLVWVDCQSAIDGEVELVQDVGGKLHARKHSDGLAYHTHKCLPPKKKRPSARRRSNSEIEQALKHADKIAPPLHASGKTILYVPGPFHSAAVDRELLESASALGALAQEVRRLRRWPAERQRQAIEALLAEYEQFAVYLPVSLQARLLELKRSHEDYYM